MPHLPHHYPQLSVLMRDPCLNIDKENQPERTSEGGAAGISLFRGGSSGRHNFCVNLWLLPSVSCLFLEHDIVLKLKSGAMFSVGLCKRRETSWDC